MYATFNIPPFAYFMFGILFLFCPNAGPFNQAITSHMRLFNPTDQKILFKIKTTAPKKYCVRPNCGTLEPNASVEVSSEYCHICHIICHMNSTFR